MKHTWKVTAVLLVMKYVTPVVRMPTVEWRLIAVVIRVACRPTWVYGCQVVSEQVKQYECEQYMQTELKVTGKVNCNRVANRESS